MVTAITRVTGGGWGGWDDQDHRHCNGDFSD